MFPGSDRWLPRINAFVPGIKLLNTSKAIYIKAGHCGVFCGCKTDSDSCHCKSVIYHGLQPVMSTPRTVRPYTPRTPHGFNGDCPCGVASLRGVVGATAAACIAGSACMNGHRCPQGQESGSCFQKGQTSGCQKLHLLPFLHSPFNAHVQLLTFFLPEGDSPRNLAPGVFALFLAVPS